MRLLRIIGLMLTMLVLYVPSSFADPITFVYTGTASGNLGGTLFSGAAFTITAFGDTANRQVFGPPPEGFFINHDSTSIFITGVGTFTFTTPLRTFVSNTQGGAGLGPVGVGLGLLSSLQPVFSTWDMLSSIGPVGGTWSADNWTIFPVFTNGGQLLLNSGSAPGTFTATVGAEAIPEPASLTLLGLGLGVASIARRLRHRK